MTDGEAMCEIEYLIDLPANAEKRIPFDWSRIPDSENAAEPS
jgi:hypothetical protein